MTSVERTGLNTYGPETAPKYNILTYTWGRWKIANGPALDIKGITWKIPAVDERHFSVAAFQRVLKHMTQDVDWVWVDVACIDQENRHVKMDEVGRQVGIFRNAHRAYVWISQLKKERLKKALDDIFVYGPESQCSNIGPTEFANRLLPALTTLFSDPWFSSLWTLQELVLRNDAQILSREVETIPLANDNHDVHLNMLINNCRNIYMDLGDLEGFSLNAPVQELRALIERAGFSFFIANNPNVQYSSARHRATKYPLDRIYAIMQVYNLRVGESVNPDRTYTLEELQDEFAEALLARSPVLGQMFIHICKPEAGKSWRITQHSNVPDELVQCRSPTAKCRFTLTTSGHAQLEGKCCKLKDLSLLWRSGIQNDYVDPTTTIQEYRYAGGRLMKKNRPTVVGFNLHCTICLDSHVHALFPEIPPEMYRSKEEQAFIYIELLVGIFGEENVWVVLLGETTAATSESTMPVSSVGLVLRFVSEGGAGYFERLGVCVWSASDVETEEKLQGIWQDNEIMILH